MMRILNDNAYLKLWVDGYSPILFVQLKSDFFGLVNALEVYTMMNIKSIRSLASTHKELYLLLDLSDVKCQEIESLIQYFENNLSKRIKASFRYISVVKSKSQGSLLLKSNYEIPVGVFGTFFEALGTINDRRINECVLN
ncbi:MAG TPA: hypothetical protein VFU05_11850 [Cyclobacteriaceae bacterium]|nr:hypothetical protein [Cyclobacteriaceae bacterium]